MIQLIGLLLPVIVDVVVKALKIVDDKIKMLVTALICLIVQFGLSYIDTQLVFASLKDGAEAISTGTFALMGLASASYILAWKDSDQRKELGLKTK